MDLNLVVLCGVSGSGKTTWRKNAVDALYSTTVPRPGVLSTDDFIERFALQLGLEYQDVFKKAIGLADIDLNERLCELVKNKFTGTIFWDQTNLTPRSRKAVIGRFMEHVSYYKRKVGIIAAVNFPIPEDQGERLVYAGKNIPAEAIQHQRRVWEPATIEEGFDIVKNISA